MKKDITFICVQPAIPYFAWQLEVMLENFKNVGISSAHQIDILIAYNTNEHDYLDKLKVIEKVERRYRDVADFFYYSDTREYPISYISSIRPNILKQHYKEFPVLEDECVFYHDCDIVFTKYPDFLSTMMANDNNWYVSDTVSYLGYNYIVSKGHDVLDKMCEIVGVHPNFIKERERQSGGAQYLLKNVNWQFWDKVEKDCERLFKDITTLNTAKKLVDPKHHELQIWCADMWAVIWNAWVRGFTTNLSAEMDFAWATSSINDWDKKYIMHNAGVTRDKAKEYFYKAAYTQKYPFLETGEGFKNDTCSIKYFEMVKAIGDKSCLL